MNKSNIGIIGGTVVLLGVLAAAYMSKSSSNSNSNFNSIPNVEEDDNRRSSLFTVRDTVSSVNKKPEGLWGNMPKTEIKYKGGRRRQRKSKRKLRQNKKK